LNNDDGWCSYLFVQKKCGKKLLHPFHFPFYDKRVEEEKISSKIPKYPPRARYGGNADSYYKISQIKRISGVLVRPGNCQFLFLPEMTGRPSSYQKPHKVQADRTHARTQGLREGNRLGRKSALRTRRTKGERDPGQSRCLKPSNKKEFFSLEAEFYNLEL